jgi:ethanolamine utilization protein EutN
MNLAKVIGCLWASARHESLEGGKLLIVSILDNKGYLTGAYEVAYDTVDAGIGDTVITVRGSSSKMTAQTEKATIDCAIVGVVDHVQR